MYLSKSGLTLCGDPIAICAIEIAASDNDECYRWLRRRALYENFTENYYPFSLRTPDGAWSSAAGAVEAIALHDRQARVPFGRRWPILECNVSSDRTMMALWVSVRLGCQSGSPLDQLALWRRSQLRPVAVA